MGIHGMSARSELRFDFHGVGVRVCSDDAEVLRRVGSDFSYFRSDTAPGDAPIIIEVHRSAPDYASLPKVRAAIYTPRNICYPDGPVTYIDYFGKALMVHDRARGQFDLTSTSIHLLHEIVFLTLVSRVCERLEQNGKHRVHALCVESDGASALFVMPSGGGKTTLGMAFLSRDLPLRIVSEDSPLIDARGRTLPFPLRLGVVGRKPDEYAEEHLTYLERMEFAPKYLISLDAFPGKFATAPSTVRFVFIGERTLGTGCTIRPVGFFATLRSLMRHMVVGVGLYQGVEFLLRSSPLDLLRMSRRIFSRFRRAVSLARTADTFEIELGLDTQANTAEVLRFLEAHGFVRVDPATREAIPA
jgi:hypothetical protein